MEGAKAYQLIYENQTFCVYFQDAISVIRIKKKVYEEIVNLISGEKLFYFLEKIKNNKKIEALLMINESNSLGRDEYKKFVLNNVVEESKNKKSLYTNSRRVTINRARAINVIKRIIYEFINFNKIIISALSGEIVTPFFGLNLSTNFRFGAENMKYLLDHRRFGLHPSGALPYFLKFFVSPPRQNEILFYKDEINAEEAMRLGLIDKILPVENFEKKSIQEINELVDKNRGSINKTIFMMKSTRSELTEYFENESVFLK